MVTRVSSQPTTTSTWSGGRPVTSRAPMGPGRTPGRSGRSSGAPPVGAAGAVGPLLEALLGTEVPVRFVFWDGSALGPEDGIGTLTIKSVDAVRRILWAPGELGVARAFVSGDLVVEGDLFALLRVLHDASRGDLRRIGWRALPAWWPRHASSVSSGHPSPLRRRSAVRPAGCTRRHATPRWSATTTTWGTTSTGWSSGRA